LEYYDDDYDIITVSIMVEWLVANKILPNIFNGSVVRLDFSESIWVV
jgi:hypothetical protein